MTFYEAINNEINYFEGPSIPKKLGINQNFLIKIVASVTKF